MREIVLRELKENASVNQRMTEDLIDIITEAAQIVIDAYRAGKKVLLIGNGGSAADAQHIAAELVGRFKMERPGLPAIALTTNTSVLTAVANDYSYEHVFSRQLEVLAEAQDVLIAITTSGTSPNILKAIQTARSKGVTVIAMTGVKAARGQMKSTADCMIVVPSDNVPRIQEAHITIGHIICQLVEWGLCHKSNDVPQ